MKHYLFIAECIHKSMTTTTTKQQTKKTLSNVIKIKVSNVRPMIDERKSMPHIRCDIHKIMLVVLFERIISCHLYGFVSNDWCRA